MTKQKGNGSEPASAKLRGVPIDLAELRARELGFQRAEKAPSTWKTYDARWRAFRLWCEAAEAVALPASPETVRLYITWSLSTAGHRLRTVVMTLCAIGERHRREGHTSPLTPEVRQYLRSCERHLKQEPAGKAPLTLEHIQKICSLPCRTSMEVRDRAIILVGFACGWRCGELAGLQYRDIAFVPEGAVLQLRHSKTDQRGRGREVGIHWGDNPETCPVSALKLWMDERGDRPGPLFYQTRGGWIQYMPITGECICRIVKKMLLTIGVDPKRYGGHSLRVGFVTKAAELGASELAIMQYTGHKAVQTVTKYIRPTKTFRHNPLKGAL